MAQHDKQFLQLVDHVLTNGVLRSNRTGQDGIGVFGYQMRFDLRDGTIPLLTTKKMHLRSIIVELLWYLMGDDNIKYLRDNKVTIWDEWAREDGSLGPVYGVQWRKWPAYDVIDAGDQRIVTKQHIDQVAILLDKLKNNPLDRRLLVTAWNVAELPQMALPPCHYSFQCYAQPLTLKQRTTLFAARYATNDLLEGDVAGVEAALDHANIPKYELSLMINQRSCDVGLGVPFNIVQYSLLMRMFAAVSNMVPGDLIWNGGDVHIYTNHIDQLKEQLTRTPYDSPQFTWARDDITSIDDFLPTDFVVGEYHSHGLLKMNVAV